MRHYVSLPTPSGCARLDQHTDGTTLIDCNATFERDGAAKRVDVFNY